MTYQIIFTPDSLGEVRYPYNDAVGARYIVLPTMASQLEQSWEHEKLHACMHDHAHTYGSPQEMDRHVHEQTYSEEELVVILAPCLIEANKVDLRKLSKGLVK